MKPERITLYVGPSGAAKAVEAGAVLAKKVLDGLEVETLSLPLLSGFTEFVRLSRSFVWKGNRGGGKEVAIVDWLHKHKIGVTYDCNPPPKR